VERSAAADHGDDEAAESAAEAFQNVASEQAASEEILARRRATEEKLGRFLATPVKAGASWSETVDAAIEADAGHPEPHPGAGFEYDSLAAFRDAARSLKAAEDAYRAAQQTYAEAVKRLSEEAVR
jgi:hypothetical protein